MDLVAVGAWSWIGSLRVRGNNSIPLSPFPLLRISCPSLRCANVSLVRHAKKWEIYAEPLAKDTTFEGVEEEADEEFIEDFDDDIIMDDSEDFEDDFETDDANIYVGDGGEGGGISLANSQWDKEVLAMAEEVSMSFGGDLKLYAFKTSANGIIKVRIEKLSSKYGSPSMSDIEAFSRAYQSRLAEAELAGRIPENISLEVSSPGVERVLRIPEDLERFKDRAMYVKYTNVADATASPQESDGIFRLISFDTELCQCTWGIADVKINRQQAGKGRPLSKKQREWRLQTPFESLRLVRVYSDC
ncbi:LOW QUALITY PROTEIN: uncharacterized protein [Typha angustifolia]|uniref:LOW QUALITY PROTEIN: uncharacterized protein n=1 Tax=Typha angustifolia TaxID=59011 RepID=UPI003C2EE9DC